MLVNPTENYIDGCPSCRVIYVHDDGSGDGSDSGKYRLYSDSRLINLLIKRTRENKLNWIPYKGSMYDQYPYTLEIEGAIFTVTYNGRNLELRMNWIYVEDPDAEDHYPKPPEDENHPKPNDDDELKEPTSYVKDYVIISNQYRPKKYPPPVKYIKYTDNEIEAILDKWDYRKPYRNITSEWQPSIFELVEAIKVYCNSKYRETTHYVDRYKSSRKTQIDYLEDLEGTPANAFSDESDLLNSSDRYFWYY